MTRIGRMVARWTTELLVVFVGVYAAFAVQEWDEEREHEERARQVRAALAEEIRDVQINSYRFALQLPGYLAGIDSALAAGEAVRPEPQMEAIGFRPHVWEATLASGGIALLDVRTFYDLSRFYNELNAGFEQLRQLRALSEAQLLPRLNDPPESFVEPDLRRDLIASASGSNTPGTRTACSESQDSRAVSPCSATAR